MHNLTNILLCSSISIRKWFVNPRIYAVGILLFSYMYSIVKPICTFSSAMGLSVHPWIFPFLNSNRITILFIMIGCILLFCDAPFIDDLQPYIIIRVGRKDWFVAQIIYIFIACAIYFAYLYLLSVVFLIPNLSLSFEWGKVIGTLSRTNASIQFEVNKISFSQRVLSLYTPLSATIWSFLLNWLTGCFIAMLLFVCNLRFNRIIGSVIANMFILLALFCYDFGGNKIYYFSPVSWIDISIIDPLALSYRPSRMYAILVLLIAIVLLIIISYIMVRKRDIDVLPQI